ncbi:MAG: Uncharacterized protein G01um10142_343 [Parcubacteria group bacterium Gr01-1014_2]|nr:MAG: Uncharacterized protein G01um10142_343 [Parcubacteria group bacterium Gr01-1014_2]
MTQKVLKVGDSAAVIIPKKSLKELGLRLGDEVSVQIDKKQRKVLIEPLMKKVDSELLDWTSVYS